VIVLEERRPEQFQVRLRAIRADTGQTTWQRESPIDPWWTNLTALSCNRAILEGYASRDLPLAKGVAVLDLDDGRLLWSDMEAQLLELSTNAALLRTTQHGIERRRWCALDDGADTEPGSTNSAHEALYPHDLTREELPKALAAKVLVGPVEGATVNDLMAIAYHTENPRDPMNLMQKSYQCTLEVFAKQRSVLKETLAAASPFPVAGNFIVLHDILIYVQEKTRLVAVRLT
jgi:hypothetical protein